MRRPMIYLLIFFWGCCSLSGCGYTATSALPSDLRTIYIEPFKNRIAFTTEQTRDVYFPLLEVTVRNDIIERFQFDGRLRVADKAQDGDLILKGELVTYEKEPLRYTDNNDVLEYRLRVIVNLVLLDNRKNLILWEEKSFDGETTYLLTGPGSVSENTAVENATLDLAKRVVEKTIENW